MGGQEGSDLVLPGCAIAEIVPKMFMPEQAQIKLCEGGKSSNGWPAECPDLNERASVGDPPPHFECAAADAARPVAFRRTANQTGAGFGIIIMIARRAAFREFFSRRNKIRDHLFTHS